MTDYRDDYKPETVRKAPHYSGALVGAGRWTILQAPLGTPAVRLYTDDEAVLGYMQVSDHPEAVGLAQTLAQALMAAKAAGAPASVVFDHWAAMALPTVGAGPVESGDLVNLSPTRPTRP